MLRFFVTCAHGLEDLLVGEVRALTRQPATSRHSGVAVAAELEAGYSIALWSRVASRVLVHLGEAACADMDGLYEAARGVDWRQHIGTDQTLAVSVTQRRSAVTHAQFAAQRIKDALVDQLREATGTRPSVDLREPDVRIHAHAEGGAVHFYAELCKQPLHRRGYRDELAAAPLRETLAAALLMRAGWPALAQGGAPFYDPLCGSATLPIEAALIAFDIAPGLIARQAPSGWLGHDSAAWRRAVDTAEGRRALGLERENIIMGSDNDPRALMGARRAAEKSGLGARIVLEHRDVAAAAPPAGAQPGLVVTNPPYGERLSSLQEATPLYRALGDALAQRFAGWRVAFLTSEQELALATGLRAERRNKFFNGPLQCTLYRLDVQPEQPRTHEVRGWRPSAAAEALRGRLRKNLRRLQPWLRASQITCYRLYDADLPEYAAAVDVYEGRAHVQEYAPPASVPPDKAKARLRDVVAVVAEVLQLTENDVFVKVRRRQRGNSQYEPQQDSGAFFEVREGGHRFWVNLADYLDTGLFLDHRLTRRYIEGLASGRRFLNLFCYTAAATVYAARGGAASSVSVDMSRAYTQWAERNLALNDIDPGRHTVVRADCLGWLHDTSEKFDLIFLDPPTFSNSKRMEGTFDVQRDHVWLIERALRCLRPGGTLIFSNNFQRFKMDLAALTERLSCRIQDLTEPTIPKDFSRNMRIHNTWRIDV